jgi:hypothetical protein
MTAPPALYSVSIRRAAAVLAALIAVIVGYFSLVPPGEAPAPQISDKIRHFVAYATLAVPVAVWFGPRRLMAAMAVTAVSPDVASAVVPDEGMASPLYVVVVVVVVVVLVVVVVVA